MGAHRDRDPHGASVPEAAGAAGAGKPARFVRESISELRKVLWPSRNELVTYSIVVIVFVTIMVSIVADPGHRVRQAGAGGVRLSRSPAPPADRLVTTRAREERPCPTTTTSPTATTRPTSTTPWTCRERLAGRPADVAVRRAPARRRRGRVGRRRRRTRTTSTSGWAAPRPTPRPASRPRRPTPTSSPRPRPRPGRGAVDEDEDPVDAMRRVLLTAVRRLVRRALLRRLREQGEDQPREPDPVPRHGGLHLPGRGPDRRTSSRSRTASASRSSARSSPATSWCGWTSTTSRGARCATRPASPVSSAPRPGRRR